MIEFLLIIYLDKVFDKERECRTDTYIFVGTIILNRTLSNKRLNILFSEMSDNI
jgi:hypothetical protein